MNGIELGHRQDAENRDVKTFVEWLMDPTTQTTPNAQLLSEAKSRSNGFNDRQKLLAANSIGLADVDEFNRMLSGEWLS
jgi:hypothetical protein